LGLSPLPLRQTLAAGFFGGLLYAMLAYSGFVYAPAGHASVLMPGSLPLWTALLAMAFLGERITLARAIGLALIVVGDLLVGGTSLLHALDGSGVWRGDVLFILAAMVWSAYSVLVRKWALHAVRATIAITMLALLTYVPVYTALLLLQWVPGQVLVAPWQRCGVPDVFPGDRLGRGIWHDVYQNDPALWPGALHHDHGPGARTLGHLGRDFPG
jgi:drug/metabolite transporter (DMT)-like permease